MKSVAVLLASAVLVLTGSANAAPAQHVDTVDPTLPTQLPRTAIPHHYAIAVTPHADRLTFDGNVGIDLDVTSPTQQLVLNAADMKLSAATLRPAKGGAPMIARLVKAGSTETVAVDQPLRVVVGNPGGVSATTGLRAPR